MSTITTKRKYYLDRLRNSIAIILIPFLHTAVSFSHIEKGDLKLLAQ